MADVDLAPMMQMIAVAYMESHVVGKTTAPTRAQIAAIPTPGDLGIHLSEEDRRHIVVWATEWAEFEWGRVDGASAENYWANTLSVTPAWMRPGLIELRDRSFTDLDQAFRLAIDGYAHCRATTAFLGD